MWKQLKRLERGRPTSPRIGECSIHKGANNAQTITCLIERYGKAANNIREGIDQAGDADTADIFTEVFHGLDKALWFLEAHVQE